MLHTHNQATRALGSGPIRPQTSPFLTLWHRQNCPALSGNNGTAACGTGLLSSNVLGKTGGFRWNDELTGKNHQQLTSCMCNAPEPYATWAMLNAMGGGCQGWEGTPNKHKRMNKSLPTPKHKILLLQYLQNRFLWISTRTIVLRWSDQQTSEVPFKLRWCSKSVARLENNDCFSSA